MDKFWSTERGKIMAHGIHEHNGGLGLINGTTSLLEMYFKEDKKISKKEQARLIDCFKDSQKRCKESMDYVYNNIKKLEDEK
jgi:hypothetical protein